MLRVLSHRGFEIHVRLTDLARRMLHRLDRMSSPEDPEMDGYAVARRLRAEDLTRQTIIVAFTALDEPTTRRSGVGAGFDAYCQKGAAPGPLLRLLETLAH